MAPEFGANHMGLVSIAIGAVMFALVGVNTVLGRRSHFPGEPSDKVRGPLPSAKNSVRDRLPRDQKRES